MSQHNTNNACDQKLIILTPDDLPLCCPQDGQELWNAHPKVYIDIKPGQEVCCPYCSTRYLLKEKNSHDR